MHKQARKNLEGLGFDPEATHSLGKCDRVPGRTNSDEFPQLVPAYTIHTATTQCGSGSYLVEALTGIATVLLLKFCYMHIIIYTVLTSVNFITVLIKCPTYSYI